MRELGLVEAQLAADPVHDLQILTLADLRQEVEEVVGLPVEAERVEAPQHERRVAHPRVAVVPVAVAARRLGQRRRRRGQQRAGRRVGQALERQRRALQRLAPRVVGERALGEPLVPEVRRSDEPLVAVGEARRGRVVAPAQRDVGEVAVVHRRARSHARGLDPESQVRAQAHLEVTALERPDALVVAIAAVLPRGPRAAVVVDRVALHVHRDRAVDAAQRAQQHVLGVVVRRRAAVRVRALAVVAPGADQQHVAHDQPAGLRAPRRLEDVRARQVAAPRRDDRVGGRQREHAGVAVEHRAEQARAVHPWHAHPLDVAARRDERRRLAVRQEGVVGDRRERAARERHVRQHRPHVSMRRAAASAGA